MLKTQIKLLFINGFAVLAILVAMQMILDNSLTNFMLYNPPFGLAFYVMVWYLIQPLIIGALNVVIRHKLFSTDGWTVGLWLNGLFLMLLFSAINLVVLTVGGLEFTWYIAAAEVLVFALPFGFIAKHSNA